MKHSLKWFKVGKRIKRGPCGTCCDSCRNPAEFTIADKAHADYLHMTALELNINYEETDTKKG